MTIDRRTGACRSYAAALIILVRVGFLSSVRDVNALCHAVDEQRRLFPANGSVCMSYYYAVKQHHITWTPSNHEAPASPIYGSPRYVRAIFVMSRDPPYSGLPGPHDRRRRACCHGGLIHGVGFFSANLMHGRSRASRQRSEVYLLFCPMMGKPRQHAVCASQLRIPRESEGKLKGLLGTVQ